MSMYNIRNAENSDAVDIYIYSDVDNAWWNDEAMGAEKFRQELEKHKDAGQINLFINSMGGSVSEGVAIYNQIKRSKAKVTAYIDGFACSIASVIPMAADRVVMGENTMLMIHNPWTFAMGNAKELRKTAEDLDKVRDGCIIPAYKAKCGDRISDEKLNELLDNETYLTAAECMEYGFCDEILSVSDDEKKQTAENRVKEAVDHAKAGFMDNFVERFGAMVAKAKAQEIEPPIAMKTDGNVIQWAFNNIKALDTPENAAEKQQESENAAKTQQEEPETPVSEPASPPTAEAHEEAPVNDKANKNDYFLKLLKGEM